jgi:long-subunit acyl-CoA synthetase (AMP-forming)
MFSLFQIADRAQAFGSGLLEKGISPNQESFLGLYSINREEVSIVDAVEWEQTPRA